MVNPSKTIDDAYFDERTTRDSETGCWNWSRNRNHQGYGMLKHKQKHQSAHRFMWKFKFGDIPEGMNVCHRCDNPTCINPEHLFLGTTQDNVDDKMQKGRFVPTTGEQSGTHKLTDAQVVAIRASTKTQYALADEYGVTQGTVSAILSGERRKTAGGMMARKKMTVKEFALCLGLPYEKLKDRIFGGYMSIGEAINRTAQQFGNDIRVPA